jgi:hypothetical protein
MLKSKFFLLISLIAFWSLAFKGHAAVVKKPLDQSEVLLTQSEFKSLHHNIKIKNSILLSCQTEVALKNCPSILVKDITRSAETGEVLENITLGKLTSETLSPFLISLDEGMDNKYDPGALIAGTGIGFLLGATQSLPLAFALGGVGLIIDLVKLPLALPYTIFDAAYRGVKKRSVEMRLRKLLKNRSYRPVRFFRDRFYFQFKNAMVNWFLTNT